MTLELNLEKGLVGHWTLDAGATSSGTAYDRSAYDNHGVINGATTGQSGIVGESYSFDGADDDVSMPNVAELKPSKEVTVSTWFKYDSSDTSRKYLYLVGRDVSSGYLAYMNGSGTLIARIGDGSSTTSYTASVSGDTWHHMVQTYTSGSGGALYVDGTQVDTIANIGDIGYTEMYGDSPTIGSHGGIYEHKGQIDDVRIYNRALSESEISALYNMRSQRNANI